MHLEQKINYWIKSPNLLHRIIEKKIKKKNVIETYWLVAYQCEFSILACVFSRLIINHQKVNTGGYLKQGTHMSDICL